MSTKSTKNSLLLLGDCLERMKEIPDGSVDMILCDLPYGTTQNKWDSVIPFEDLWQEYNRICKTNAAIVLTGSQPFSSLLVHSNIKAFRYEWIWVKSKITGVLNAKKMPVRKHEQILVFYKNLPTYNAQNLVKLDRITRQGRSSENYGERKLSSYSQEFTNWPRDVLDFPSEGKTVHPTQKPIQLLEYLIKTYTNNGELILDNTMGSGSTGVAAINTERRFVGIEKESKYFDIAFNRIEEAEASISLGGTISEQRQ